MAGYALLKTETNIKVRQKTSVVLLIKHRYFGTPGRQSCSLSCCTLPLGNKVNKKSGDHNDIEAHVFEVLLYVASCSECLTRSNVRIFHLFITGFNLS